jgi:hypothetical protein
MNWFTQSFSMLFTLGLFAGCEGTAPEPGEITTVTINASDVYHQPPAIDLEDPTTNWTIDAARAPINLSAIRVRSEGRDLRLPDWLENLKLGQILEHGVIQISHADGVHITVAGPKCNCRRVCEGYRCYHVCFGDCEPLDSGESR